MVRYIKKVFIFFLLIVLIDLLCGYFFQYLRVQAKGGDTHKNYYIGEMCIDDVLILGSSRAARHYNPIVFEDSLGMSCYNCGEPGCGIITAYARYKMIISRHKPKLIIYELTPSFDYLKTDDYSKYLGRVRQYSYKPEIKHMFIQLGDKLERLRLLSNLYVNNSFILFNVLDYINRKDDNANKGFYALDGSMRADAKPGCWEKKNEIDVDSIKLSYIESLISQTRNDSIPICFILSPKFLEYTGEKNTALDHEPIVKLCKRYDVPFINHIYMKGISDNPKLFQDYEHMNYRGATAYSDSICKELKEILYKDSKK